MAIPPYMQKQISDAYQAEYEKAQQALGEENLESVIQTQTLELNMDNSLNELIRELKDQESKVLSLNSEIENTKRLKDETSTIWKMHNSKEEELRKTLETESKKMEAVKEKLLQYKLQSKKLLDFQKESMIFTGEMVDNREKQKTYETEIVSKTGEVLGKLQIRISKDGPILTASELSNFQGDSLTREVRPERIKVALDSDYNPSKMTYRDVNEFELARNQIKKVLKTEDGLYLLFFSN